MPTYDNKHLRREILKTLHLMDFAFFRVTIVVDSLRPTGFPDLTESSLMAQTKYLEQKGFVELERKKNILTGEESDLISITAKGIDLIEGNCTDVGISSG